MADSDWHYLKEKTYAFFGVLLGFMFYTKPKKMYLFEKKAKMQILPGTECEIKK